MIADVVSWVLLVAGGLVGIAGGIGLHRFPDFFARMHATGVTDTGCASLILFGLMVQAGLSLVTVKLALTLVFLLVTGPTATHALARAALHGGLRPRTRSPESSPWNS